MNLILSLVESCNSPERKEIIINQTEKSSSHRKNSLSTIIIVEKCNYKKKVHKYFDNF